MKCDFDQTDLAELYRKLEKPVFNVIYRWLWNSQEAQDVVQEAFLRVWKMRERIERQTVDALVYRTALNLAQNRRRRLRLWKLFSPGEQNENHIAEETMLKKQSAEEIRQAVERLPEPLKQVLFLCEFSEMSYEEVGRTLSIPPGTVGSRKNKALQLLREQLGQQQEEPHVR